MELFYAKGTVAQAALIALHEADIPFTATRMDFSQNAQQSSDFLARNPKGRVPTLITDHGVLTETPAMLPYIAGLNPATNLLPTDPYQLAKMNELTSYLASTAHVNHAHRMRGSRWADEQSSFEDMQRKVPQNMRDTYNYLETEVFRGPWVMGEQYTVADAYLFTVGCWLEGDSVDINEFPAIAAHAAAMRKRPAVIAALAY